MFEKIFIVFCIAYFVLNPLSEVKALNARTMQEYEFIGTWKGEGKIIVGWCNQKQLSFELRIDLEGNVSGKIGDAHIRSGKIKLNNIIYRWLGNSEYIIDAKLSNYLIEKEEIKRESIRIFLDFKQASFTGGFHTSGSKSGGKEKMILSGASVKLVK
ncbi:MAG: hypothetical protein H8D87_14375 [Deltaproteobacteria bacterium]|uniref:hypothetical protein n=1 Tax=Desulfobacula sp. TaxID=2593537 RepID=UPI0019B98F46|nr:hypothetical protein [Candidatus Desulfobacula maris]